jgi:hypothetical protein
MSKYEGDYPESYQEETNRMKQELEDKKVRDAYADLYYPSKIEITLATMIDYLRTLEYTKAEIELDNLFSISKNKLKDTTRTQILEAVKNKDTEFKITLI